MAILTTAMLLLLSSCSISVDKVGGQQSIEPKEQENIISAVVKEMVMYSDHGIEAICKGVNETAFTYEIVNNSENNIRYCIVGVAVNHCMVYDMMMQPVVTAGNRVVEEYDLAGAKDYGISRIETLDIYLILYNSDYSTLDEVIYHIDVAPILEFAYVPSSPAFYEDEYVSAYIESGGSEYRDIEVIYYNSTDDVLSTTMTEISINGVMLSYPDKSLSYIIPDCYAYTGASNGTTMLWNAIQSEVEEKKLEPIKTIEAKMMITGNGLPSYVETTEKLRVFNASD